MAKQAQDFANRPDNTAFTQQRLPAWQPMLSAGIVIPGFVLIGLAFIGIGVALLVTSQSIQVFEMDYTGVGNNHPCFHCSDPKPKPCVCKLNFTIDFFLKGPVFFYYGLSNYFQNYRKYSVSKDDDQLSGNLKNFESPSDTCSPYQRDNNKPIVPCGSIANSMFNDTFKLYQNVNATMKPVPFDGKGIAWWTDYNIKYRNPDTTPLRNAFNNTVKPIFWPVPAYELDPKDPANNGFINQNFLVWMRTAALPDFRKLYARINDPAYAEGLPAGSYMLEIQYNYPVLAFGGTKKVVFSNVSWMGGKNDFLGIAYLVIGTLCVLMSIVMLIVYAKFKFPEED